MGKMTDIMVDVETTGTDPEQLGILQLSAIKFNLQTLEVGDSFDRFPGLLPKRVWSDSTKDFWQRKFRPYWLQMVAKEEEPIQVYKDFDAWVSSDSPDGGYRFWAKPIKFDWTIVESHLSQLGIAMPFPHWNAYDVHSYIAGLKGEVSRTDIESQVPFSGVKHNALHDAAYQIDLLFHAKRNHVAAEVA